MPSTEKELMYQEVVNQTTDKSIFFSSVSGMTVSELESFRKDIRKIEANSFIVKKTLIKKRFSELGVDDIDAFLDNHVMLTTIEEEPQRASKVLVDYEKALEKKFAVKGIFADGQIKDRDYVVNLSKLPSREVMLATMMGTMNAPLSNFVLTLNGVVRAFTIVLKRN